MREFDRRKSDREPLPARTAEPATIAEASADQAPEPIDPVHAEAVARARSQVVAGRYAPDEEIAVIYRRAGL